MHPRKLRNSLSHTNNWTKALVIVVLFSSGFRAGAIGFTNDVITWNTHVFEYKTVLVDSEEPESWYTLGVPRDWTYRFQTSSEIRYLTDLELVSVIMRIARSGQNFPEFREEEDLKHYARELVANLPENVESRGKIRKDRPWLRYKNWNSLTLSMEYVQFGNKMKIGMGFSLNPENRDEQLRWIINARAEDYEDVYRKFSNSALGAWGLIDVEERNELESGEVIMD
jgi:hypothetical protein